MIRGDLLVYTNKDIKRIDKLTETDILLNHNFQNSEIESIEKKSVKNYYLYKIKTNNNIDNYYLDANNTILTIQNIPYDLRTNDCVNYIKDNLKYCSPSLKTVKDITDFDYIGFPYLITNFYTEDEKNKINEIKEDNYDKYRFQGLFLLSNNKFELNNNLNRNTIGFLNKYLHNNNIDFELIDNNINSIITIKNESELSKLLLSTDELLNLTYFQTLHLIRGFNEINSSSLNISNKNQFYLIKFLYMKIGYLISANYNKNTNNYMIKIPNINDETVEKNYFVYNNYLWTKIKRIEKIEKYTGFLYKLIMRNKDNYLSEIGIIS